MLTNYHRKIMCMGNFPLGNSLDIRIGAVADHYNVTH